MATATSELTMKAQAARTASRGLRNLPTVSKNQALSAIADALESKQTAILEANALDMVSAQLVLFTASPTVPRPSRIVGL